MTTVAVEYRIPSNHNLHKGVGQFVIANCLLKEIIMQIYFLISSLLTEKKKLSLSNKNLYFKSTNRAFINTYYNLYVFSMLFSNFHS